MEPEVRDCKATLSVTANEDAKIFRQEPQVTLIKLIFQQSKNIFLKMSKINILNDRMH